MAFVDGGNGCRCKKIKTSLHEKQVSSSQQPSRREEESLNRFRAAPLTPQHFHGLSLAALSCQVSVFGSLSLWKTPVLSAHQFEAAFPLPASVENTIKEKNQCILAIKKSIAFIESIFSVEWCRDSYSCPAAICGRDPFFHIHLFIIHYFLNPCFVNHRSVNVFFPSHWGMHRSRCVYVQEVVVEVVPLMLMWRYQFSEQIERLYQLLSLI